MKNLKKEFFGLEDDDAVDDEEEQDIEKLIYDKNDDVSID